MFCYYRVHCEELLPLRLTFRRTAVYVFWINRVKGDRHSVPYRSKPTKETHGDKAGMFVSPGLKAIDVPVWITSRRHR